MRNLVFLLLLSAAVDGLAAQDSISTGTRIRFSTPGAVGMGRFIALSRDSLLLGSERPNSFFTVPLHVISSVEQSKGGNSGTGALRGALIGTVAGAILAGFASVPNTDGMDDKLAWTATGLVVGQAMGAVVGAAAGRERWQTVQLTRAQTDSLPPIALRAARSTQSKLDLLGPDTPVRFRIDDGRSVQGLYAGYDARQVLLAGVSPVPLISIVAIQERKSATNLYAARGALAGAIIGGLGLAIPAALSDSCEGYDSCVDMSPVFAAVSAVAGGVVGFLTGALIGSRSERWQTMR